jgi:hypothetical protein
LDYSIQATNPDARLVAANPGDWGIDVVVGDLDGGDVEIFQAKYFYPLVETNHHQQIRDSFKAAISAAAEHGYRVTRWTLCVPSSMDGPTKAWWDRWKKAKSAESHHGLSVDLWDETTLRRKLLDPRAREIREGYYGRHTSPSTVIGNAAPHAALLAADVDGYSQAEPHRSAERLEPVRSIMRWR